MPNRICAGWLLVGLCLATAIDAWAQGPEVDATNVTEITVQPGYRSPQVEPIFQNLSIGYQPFVFRMKDEGRWELTNFGSTSAVCTGNRAPAQQTVNLGCGQYSIAANLTNKTVYAVGSSGYVLIGTVTGTSATQPVKLKATGTVTGATGDLVEGAVVTDKNTGQKTTTDASGRYELEITNEKAVMVASYPGASSQEAKVSSGALADNVYTVNLTLGEVVTEITVQGAAWYSEPEAQEFARGLGLGQRYVFSMTEKKQWELRNEGSPSLVANCQEQKRDSRSVDLSCAGRLIQLNLSTKQVLANYRLMIGTVASTGQSQFRIATAKVKGVVTEDKDGKPLSQATVIEKGQSRKTYTDANGQYTLDVADGNATLTVSYPATEPREVKVNTGTLNDNVYTLGDLALGCVSGREWYPVGDSCLAPGAKLLASGKVTFLNGRGQKIPIIGGTVEAKWTSEVVRTDSNGNYQVEVPDGNAVLVFDHGSIPMVTRRMNPWDVWMANYEEQEVAVKDYSLFGRKRSPVPGRVG